MNCDVVVVGAGPAGLSAALNLVRARHATVVLDSNRPRNAATFHSHGFLTRDGISPLELRSLGRDELAVYPGATFAKTTVSGIRATGDGFVVSAKDGEYAAKTVLIATGVTEQLPALPSLRAFYGTSIHSCIECDGFEYADQPIALIGESSDLAERALLLSQWSRDLIVFTNGIAAISESGEARLGERGIRVERAKIADVAGDRSGLTGVTLATGETIARSGAFVRPGYRAALGFAAELGLEADADGFIVVDGAGRTNVRGVYAAGDSAAPGPQQLIVAAGLGARTAAAITLDLVNGFDTPDRLTYR